MAFESRDEILKIYKSGKKHTPAVYKIRLNSGEALENIERELEARGAKVFGGRDFVDAVGELEQISPVVERHSREIKYFHKEILAKSTPVPLADYSKFKARIERGALIKEHVKIGKDAVVMMGAIIHVGAEIGDETMVDMGAIVGSCAKIGKRVHLAAGCVIGGVLEPPSAKPTHIDDDAFIGANAFVMSGLKVGVGAVVAAGAVVTKDVPPFTVVGGVPAKELKVKDSSTHPKTKISKELRHL